MNTDPIFNDPVLVFGLVTLILLFAPAIFKKIGLPEIIGIIVFGMIFGPSALNVLGKDSGIELFGTVGLIYILFIAALEVDITDFIKNKYKSLIFGILTFIIPSILGFVVFYFLLGKSVSASILFGSMLSAHTLVSYPIVSKLSVTSNSAVVVTLGGTIITDTLALIVLAVVSQLHISDKGTFSVTLSLFALLAFLIFFSLYIIPKIGYWFFKVSYDQVNQYIFVLFIVFLCASLAHIGGMKAIVGAFLAGLGLNVLINKPSALMHRIEFVGKAIFIPFFLISIGMKVNFDSFMKDEKSWLAGGLMILIAHLGKFTAAFITQKILKYSSTERNIIYGLSTSQVAAALAISFSGYELGLFGEDVFNGTILLVFFNIFSSALIVEKFAKLLAISKEGKKTFSEDENRILVPIANPKNTQSLVDIAITMQESSTSDKIFSLAVIKDKPNYEKELQEKNEILENVKKHALETGTSITSVSKLEFNITDGIIRSTKELNIDQLIIGWNGKITSNYNIFGSVLDKLLEELSQSVLVVKVAHPINIFKNIRLFCPKYCEYEPGYTKWLQKILKASKKINVNLKIYSTNNTRKSIEQIAKDEFEIQYHSFEKWENYSNLADDFLENDLVVAVSARKGTISYHNVLNQIPKYLVNKKQDFCILYPSLKK